MQTFWVPENLNSAAFVELVEAIDASAEVAAILRVLDGMRDVVDVGGGTGFLTQQIAERARVIVIEPSAEQRARVPAGIDAREGRAEALPLDDRSVDAAIATWGLQYCDEPRRAVGHHRHHRDVRRQRPPPAAELREHRAVVRPVVRERPRRRGLAGEEVVRRGRVVDGRVRHRPDHGTGVDDAGQPGQALAEEITGDRGGDAS
jgi:SAM-dependent methyltransferase